jgi:hypothetical protein
MNSTSNPVNELANTIASLLSLLSFSPRIRTLPNYVLKISPINTKNGGKAWHTPKVLFPALSTSFSSAACPCEPHLEIDTPPSPEPRKPRKSSRGINAHTAIARNSGEGFVERIIHRYIEN